MAIIFRCDVCKKEVTTFWNVTITRKKIFGTTSPPITERELGYDVCSQTCETKVITRILTKLLPPEAIIEEGKSDEP
jgi:hypothetical protein